MKAQAATEYVAIIAIGLLILIPIVAYLNDLYISYRDENKIASAKTAAIKITSISNWIFSQGEPAKNIIQVYIPPDVERISFVNNSIVFDVVTRSGIQQIREYSVAALTGNVTNKEGYYYILIQATDNGVSISVI
ncbi:MAG: hypothetical protein N3D75_03275 [Candidatus Aenigmarchaeota archaeon]|nr:hypothetical protein [Candidatus Aenigmarchaeota archaeon]